MGLEIALHTATGTTGDATDHLALWLASVRSMGRWGPGRVIGPAIRIVFLHIDGRAKALASVDDYNNTQENVRSDSG